MATHDYIISNASGAAVRADLNNALAAIATNNSSATEPTTTYAYQWWADTGSSPTVMKLRNATNNGWVTLFQLDGEWTVVPFENGTAAAPSIYFKDSGTDTGIYSPGTDQVAITTGGTGRFFVTSTGSVGIGTGSPSQKLEVQGSAVLFGNGSSDVDIIMGVSGYGSRLEYSTGKLSLRTNSSNRLTIDNSGNVGIGTTSPQAALTVIGSTSYIGATNVSARFSDNVTSNFAIGHPSGGGIDLVGNNGLNFCTSDGTTKSERARLDSSGRWLLGTSSSISNVYVGGSAYQSSLQIAGNAAGYQTGLALLNYHVDGYAPTLSFGTSRNSTLGSNTLATNNTDLGIINFTGNDGTNFRSGAYIIASVDGTSGTADLPTRLSFWTTADGASSPTERMRITNTGRAYFNTGGSAPSSTVYGVQIGAPGDNFWSSSASTTTAYNQFAFWNPNGVVGTISTSGSATAYNTSSDYRLKENISAVTDGITRLQQLKPSRFNFIADPDKTVDGFIAHEVQTVVPEAITGEKDAVDDDGNPIYQGIDQSKLVPLLTAALQEAVAKIESLEARLTAAGI